MQSMEWRKRALWMWGALFFFMMGGSSVLAKEQTVRWTDYQTALAQPVRVKQNGMYNIEPATIRVDIPSAFLANHAPVILTFDVVSYTTCQDGSAFGCWTPYIEINSRKYELSVSSSPAAQQLSLTIKSAELKAGENKIKASFKWKGNLHCATNNCGYEIKNLMFAENRTRSTVAAARPTATPRPAPTARPRPTATPRPAPTARPRPTATPRPAPTAMPTRAPIRQPTPTPIPPVEEDDLTVPTIILSSTIPEKTDAQELTISCVANDDGGMAVVRVSVGQTEAKGLSFSSAHESTDEERQTILEFQKTVMLEPGNNQIRIEAIDLAGNVAMREMTVVRMTSDVTGETASESSSSVIPGQRYAVIIGIGAYQDERLNLSYTVNDAQGLYDLLTDPRYGAIPKENVQLLLSEEATTVNIKKALNGLRRKATEDDTVIIYYSGHGAPEEDQTYWVTYDADIDDLRSTALSSNDIADMLDQISSKQLVTFLDSCYSAATVKRTNQSRSLPTEVPWEKFTGEGRVIVSASNGKELSLELDEYKHGIFTYYLLEGLKGKADRNDDGYVEVEEIWDFVKRQVQDKARAEGNKQTPILQGELSAGIALTMNAEAFKKKTVDAQIQQLVQWFESGELDERHFDCAIRMLEAGKSNRALDTLLKGTLSVKTFNLTFRCE